MAYRVKMMPRAQRDLAGLYDWIGALSSDAALAWYRGLRDAIRALRVSPHRCPATPEDRDLRHLLYGNKPHVYRVIYRILEQQKQVDVLHIRHGARQEFDTDKLT
jgi:toxin ParE1/3/4